MPQVAVSSQTGLVQVDITAVLKTAAATDVIMNRMNALADYVSVCLSWHGISGVLVEEFVDTRLHQTISDLHITQEDDKSRALFSITRIHLVLYP